MSDFNGVRMYFGSSSGSAHKALRIMEEPHIMLSAVTDRNHPWDGIEELFVDSGGYSLLKRTGKHWPVEDYLDTVEKMGADVFAVQDYPCEPDILSDYDRSVEQHQEMTVDRTREVLDRASARGIDAEPLTVIQGWRIDDYLHHIDRLAEEGCLTERIGIGSICRRGQYEQIRRIIAAVHGELPNGTRLHAFGVKSEVMGDRTTRHYLDSADSCAWYQYSHQEKIPSEPTFQTFTGRYIEYWRTLADLSGSVDPEPGQHTLSSVIE